MNTQTTTAETKKQSLIQSTVKVALCIAVLAAFGMPMRAHAQSCSTYVQDIINKFGTIPPGGEGVIQVALVSNRSDGRYASYGEMPSISERNGDWGPLVYHPGGIAFPAYLQGTLTQFFSDRRTPQQGVGFVPSDPFDPQATDSLGVTIFLGSSPRYRISPGEVVLTLNSWGGARITFQGRCEDGMINGFYQNSQFVLSLFNQGVIPPVTIK